MIFRASGDVNDPHKQIILDLGYTKLLKLIQAKTQIMLGECVSEISKIGPEGPTQRHTVFEQMPTPIFQMT